jgi:hypothetical protein
MEAASSNGRTVRATSNFAQLVILTCRIESRSTGSRPTHGETLTQGSSDRRGVDRIGHRFDADAADVPITER